MKTKRYVIGILLGVFSLGLILWFGTLEVFQSLELKALDYRFRYRPPHKVNEDIALIGIDDHDLSFFGCWPLPRQNYAALLEALSEYPPGCIGFDILFIEPRESDEALVYHSRILGDVVYAGYIRESDNVFVRPIEGLSQVSKIGLINVPPDKDGVIRKIPLVIKHKNKLHPSLTLQILCEFLDIEFSQIKIVWGKSILLPGLPQEIPIDEAGCMWINYVGDQHVFKEYSFRQMLRWDNMQVFANKLVLVGLTATGASDRGSIPVATNVPLIAVHANAINTILNGDYLRRMPYSLALTLIIFMVILSVVINVSLKPFKAAGMSLVILVGFSAVNFWSFMNNLWIDLIQPLGALVIPFILITIYRYGWEERELRWIKKAFSHYLSKDVIQEVISSPERLKLGGEEREATVLFLDLRNFTTFSEGRSPTEVVGLLNKSFDWMTESILNHGGMLDKYIGDAIMAIFGAPAVMPVSEQAKRAVSAALEIVRKQQEQSGAALGIGIGINTGSMVVGNMGSSRIFNYTAIGDEVNVAMRIQTLTRKYNVNIIVTEHVYQLVKDIVKAESLGDVAVKGRKEPVRVYALVEK